MCVLQIVSFYSHSCHNHKNLSNNAEELLKWCSLCETSTVTRNGQKSEQWHDDCLFGISQTINRNANGGKCKRSQGAFLSCTAFCQSSARRFSRSAVSVITTCCLS